MDLSRQRNSAVAPKIVRLEVAGQPLFLVVYGRSFVDENDNQVVEAISMCQIGGEGGPLTPVEVITVEVTEPAEFPPGGPGPGTPGYGRRVASARLENGWPLNEGSSVAVRIRGSMSDGRTGDVECFIDIPAP